MATIKECLNNTNGWQRIYIAIVLFGIAVAIGNIYTEIQYGRLSSELLGIIGTLVGMLSLLYFIGWMVAWIRKGFKTK